MMRFVLRPLALSLLLLNTAQSAPAAAAAPAPASTSAMPEIRYAEPIDTPTSMPGNVARNTSTDDILGHVVESLVALRSDMSVAPMLADSWTISPDGTVYTFRLREGVKFHNGAPVTSAEVKWSFDYLMDPRSNFVCRGVFEGSRGAHVLAVRTPDPHTVVFELKQPYALFLKEMANTRCPLAVLHPASVDAQGHWARPIGTGPYVFSEWRKGQYVLLEPFKDYKPRPEKPDGMAGAKVAWAPVRFVVIPDKAAQKSALQSGQVDAIAADDGNLPPLDPGWRIVDGPGMQVTGVLMQTRDPLLSNPLMRRAIAHAVDLRGVVAATSNGRAKYNPSLMPDSDSEYDAQEASGYRYDPAETKRLLAAAGYRGETITIEASQQFPALFRLAIYMQSLLRKAGIHAELNVVEWARQLDDFRSGHYQMMTMIYSSRLDPAQMYADVLGDKSKRPMLQWQNRDASRLLKSLAGVSDPAVRKDALGKLHDMMLADTPMLPMYDLPDLHLVSVRLEGFESFPLNRVRLFNVKKLPATAAQTNEAAR
ncbi:ABC transporter substrate-binding protein [Paraburkholderia unamae]|uniref:Peptide/nickel transport system substrate-binding protein n=1 Tax=Paraburkholderia unamae TaxID=219649 RepID=A0ABX5K742_9BURK|nr:ABC transporter substrate-binding protein [Paraburkholderia unamae]PVX61346.1 peptide/nickel transport system substrate-binding protein [Paraburkholderia unamae]